MKKIFSIISLIILFNTLLFASENLTKSHSKVSTYEEEKWFSENPESLPIWMTEEEKSRKDEIGKDFVKTDPPPLPVRQSAEFEPMEGVLIRYPLGISTSIIAEMSEDVIVYCVVTSSQQSSAYSTFANAGVNMDNVQFINCQTDSYWIRDYGPWFIFNGENQPGIVDFVYNRPRPHDNLVPIHVGNYFEIEVYAMDIVHTGGNYMTDGQHIAISTNLVWQENPGLSHTEIDSIMYEYLGISTYHVVPDALGEYIKHIDCWAKYLAPDVIMIIEVSPSHSHYAEIEAAVEYFESQLSCYGTPYQIERVYTHLYEPYINSLILNDKVLVPITGSQWDADAIASYQAAIPGYEVLGFTGSWYNTDALHCRTMGVTDRFMLYIEHTPLQDTDVTDDDYLVQALIYPYSSEPLITDSLLVYWKTSEDDEFVPVQMEQMFLHYYYAYIPAQPSGTTIQYYIHTADNSGRSENHPYIGAPMAHSFTILVPEYGTIEGTVTLSGGVGNVEDVDVTAGEITVNPNNTGYYVITIEPGIYDVTASLAGYIDSTIADVEVLAGETTTDIDFILYPEVVLSLSLPLNAEGCPNSSVSIPLTLDNPDEIEIEGIDVVITFDEVVINATGATLEGGVLEYEDYGFFANTDVDGEITLIFYAMSDLFTGSGIIAYLVFDVVGDEGDCTSLVFTQADVNENPVTANDGYFTAIPCNFDISGNIGYFSDDAPIPNVTLELTGNNTYSTTTDESGDYFLNDIPGGNYISTPSKTDDLGGLSGTDASRIARYAAGLYSFNCLQMIAADVSMNGYISGMDASRVARYIAGLITELNSNDINWVFTPEPIPECEDWPPIVYENTREYSPLESDLIDENFIGIRLGDVSGNWSPEVRESLTYDPSEITNIETGINSTLRIPVVIDEVTPIEGIDISIAFDSEVLKLTELTLQDCILADHDYAVETNLKDGKIVIYAQRDLVSEAGAVAFIEFDIIGVEGSKTEIYFTKFDVNETEHSGGFQIIDSEGKEVTTKRLEVNIIQHIPAKLALYPNYPNPFITVTKISYNLPVYIKNPTIEIFNIKGEKIRLIKCQNQAPIIWDGRDQLKNQVSSGIYLYRIRTDDFFSKTKKMVLLK
ncbi:MAG: agmatine deiminase family protein [Candidatus Cloacimonetes bacterium]|nr:agmatine deiminase family protein [Candidatus Cloacimonadota bacterium]